MTASRHPPFSSVQMERPPDALIFSRHVSLCRVTFTMDTMDRSDSNVPARFPADSFRAPAQIYASPTDPASAATVQITPQVLLRGLSRHWWRILLLWVVVSTPLAYLIYSLIRPSYEAFSMLQVQPTQGVLFNPMIPDSTERAIALPYLETQVNLITSNMVLDSALARPASANAVAISRQPMIANSKDPKSDLRKEMVVEILKNTFLIRVSLLSPDPEEAAAIVNAVVDSYLEQHGDYHRSANKALKKGLDEEIQMLDVKIAEKKKELKALIDKGNVKVFEKRVVRSNGDKEDGVTAPQSALATVTEEQYMQSTNALLQTEMDLLEAQADLDAAKEQLARTTAASSEQPTPRVDEELEKQIAEEFKFEPEAVALVTQMNDAEERLEDIKSKARRDSDPARAMVEKQIRKLKQQWDTLWEEKHDKLARQLLIGDTSNRPDVWQGKIVELEVRLEKLKKKKLSLADRIKSLEIQTKVQSGDAFSARMAEQELSSLIEMQEIIHQKLEELRFSSKQADFRVTRHDEAQVPMAAANNKRMKYIAAAPVGIMFLVIGLFLIMEIKAQRIADPDALSTRVKSEVFALPPLPTARSIRKRSTSEADDQIEQFIQRLDHVRFAVCGNPSDVPKGRCVLITSAVGREGKTTLAAQLAARCGNAGMSTLLIDADLRRTGLCSLLDVPEGPGLSDLLASDEFTPNDLVIPVQGGTFHLLPAGTPIPDPSRGLQNRKLGLLITQFRQIYDLVIIDSPPVLPVPDALMLGRWADGAVLAVRYDASRFPQVERARRQLDAAGICILGTVINGMRNSDSYYGSYSYSRRSTPQADPSAAI
jgi:succinoglycan biosynthesis transport protein ExoP